MSTTLNTNVAPVAITETERKVNPDAANSTGSLSYRIARTQADREGAFRVLYRSYVRAGLTSPNEHEIRVTPFHLLEETVIVVGELDGEIVSTVTLVLDSENGLPIDALYQDSIDELRKFGVRSAELCCLADRRDDPARGLESVIEMSKIALYYAMKIDIDCLLLIAHPRHGRFYKRAMGFRAIDEVRACPYVQNRPAEPLLLNLPELKHHQPRLYNRYFGEPIEPQRLELAPISKQEIDYFSQFAIG